MRLEHLCELELRYDDTGVVTVQPYGSAEGNAFGTGTGAVRGDRLSGTLRWTNHPHRRSDGTFLPDVHGVITTGEGASILFSFGGRTGWANVRGEKIGVQLLTCLMESDADAYRWVNDAVCVIEGLIDPVAMKMQAQMYACVNELPER